MNLLSEDCKNLDMTWTRQCPGKFHTVSCTWRLAHHHYLVIPLLEWISPKSSVVAMGLQLCIKNLGENGYNSMTDRQNKVSPPNYGHQQIRKIIKAQHVFMDHVSTRGLLDALPWNDRSAILHMSGEVAEPWWVVANVGTLRINYQKCAF